MDKKVVVDVQVDASQSVNSMKSIKNEIKSLQGAALQGNQDAIKRIAELKDKIEDLGDATKTLKGSGVEKVTSSFGLLGQGFKDFDFDKIKTGFKGIGSAMSAIPIFLVAEGVAYLVENWKELGEGNGIVAKGIQLLNKAFDEIVGTITTFTDLIGLSNSALDKQGEAIQTNADKSKEALSEQNAEYDRQIRVAKAAGQSTVELEIAKQQAIIDTNVQIAKQIEAFVRAGGELDEEKRKLLTASLESIKNAKVTEFEIEQNQTKKLNDEYKKRQDDKKKSQEESNALFEQLSKEQDAQEQKDYDEKQKLEESRAKIRKQMTDQENAEQIAQNKILEDEFLNGDKRRSDAREKDRQEELAAWNEKLQIASNVTNSISNLSEAVFAIRNSQLKKGSEEEEKAARRQFQIRKALQLAGAVIDGGKAITASLASSPLAIGIVPNPVGIASLAAAITNTAFSIAKIASTQYQSSGGGGGSSSAPPITSAGSGSAPSTQAPSTGSLQPFTRLNEDGSVKNGQIKAYVVESDMTDKQKRVGRLEGQASFG